VSICPHCGSEYSSKKERMKKESNTLKFICPVCLKATKIMYVGSIIKSKKVVAE